ncbi:MAG: hypothetical protein IJZ40_06475 [Bacteroidaceae bacterium]|nr:hypothetical protein [Bacteroidaceae bacterium]
MKAFKTILLVVAFLFFASWFYKIVVLMLLAFTWRKEIKAKKEWGYKVVMGILLVAMFCVLPRYRYNTSDRIQLIYQDKKGNPEYPPLTHYLVNVFLPEEEICNIGIWGARIVPKVIPLANWILEEFNYDDKKGNISKFMRPFNRLNWDGLFMMSGTTSQIFNMAGIDNTQSVYLIKPKNHDKNKEYPVVFFMHGYLGNWKLYQGVLKGLEDFIVLSVGTKTWSGIYTKHDINALFTKQIPFLENLGYKVDKDNLHIMGLSNGGSAVNVAYNGFSKKFKTITFISTGIHQTYPISSKVLLIGGGKDHSSGSLHGAHRTLKSNGTKTDLYWDDEDTHFILVNQTDEIIDFLNRNLKVY